MKAHHLPFLSVALLLSLFAPALVSAQSAANTGLPSAPTIKVLAIGHIVGPMTLEIRRNIMPSEVRETVKLYLGGKIDQWYVRQDTPGVVFLMNVSTVAEAHDMLEKLPLGQAKLMAFDLVPLGPLTPLSVLLANPSANPAAASAAAEKK